MSEDYLNKTKDENCTGKPIALIHPENLTTMSMGSVASSQDVRTLLMGNLIRDERFEVEKIFLATRRALRGHPFITFAKFLGF